MKKIVEGNFYNKGSLHLNKNYLDDKKSENSDLCLVALDLLVHVFRNFYFATNFTANFATNFATNCQPIINQLSINCQLLSQKLQKSYFQQWPKF